MVRSLDWGGLKSNWEAFKEFVQREGKGTSILTEYYFVFREDDCGDEAYILQRILTQMIGYRKCFGNGSVMILEMLKNRWMMCLFGS